jgi:hypothetical protein
VKEENKQTESDDGLISDEGHSENIESDSDEYSHGT